MVAIPPLKLIAGTLEPGTTYYFVEKSFQSIQPHYFVVLNRDPFETVLLITVNATSKIEKREDYITRNGMSLETLVKVTPAECSFLTVESVFDCNYPIALTIQELIQRCESDKFQHKGVVSQIILEKLRSGLKASTLVRKEWIDLC